MAIFTFKLRRGRKLEWEAANPVLRDGEPGVETDTDKHKIGDGVRDWNSLPYYLSENSIRELINEVVVAGPEEISDLTLIWENAKA